MPPADSRIMGKNAVILDDEDSSALESTLAALRSGELFVYPTDTLYGFGGDARSGECIAELYDIKRRPQSMPVSMLVHSGEMITEYARVTQAAGMLIRHFLPGALTLVLPAARRSRELPEKLLQRAGRLPRLSHRRSPSSRKRVTEAFPYPVISTSVNISGMKAMHRIAEIEECFGKNFRCSFVTGHWKKA
ncbi:MAG: L-threonylcarbamoyladenylate synthase [Candidatus Marinimicrobia bacterium]|nr:L-threonylcarbamoyladenylate synthase [Candidatus Neomarinimicrobiota bacterium]